jgi:hypothetical protein
MEKLTLWMALCALGCGLVFAQADSPQATQPATQPAATPSSGSGASTSTPPTGGTITLANVRSWRGTLIDANCTSGTAASSPAAESSSSAEEKDTKSSDSENASGQDKTAKPHKNHRNRMDPSQAQSCPVSSSTTAFALKTKEGQILKFDSVGNTRAVEELKTKWAQHLSAGKPIHTKVSGSINGDTVTVTSVD